MPSVPPRSLHRTLRVQTLPCATHSPALKEHFKMHDTKTIEGLVSPDIVVFENGHRNDGWPDFRNHHLLPQFKASSEKYKTELVRVETTPRLAWVYSKMNRSYRSRRDDTPDVWAIYILRKDAIGWRLAMVDWSVRRLE